MSKDIRIKKGLDINLLGAAALSKSAAIISNYNAIRLEDFHGVVPKLIVKEGYKLKAGEAVFFDESACLSLCLGYRKHKRTHTHTHTQRDTLVYLRLSVCRST